jgi:hypothetical protein
MSQPEFPREPPRPDPRSAQSPPQTERHPRGTLFLVGLYGLIFAAAWFAFYFFLYLGRGPVTP